MSKELENISTMLFKPTAPVIEGWNDLILAKLKEKTHFPLHVYNRNNLKRILARFFEFYLNGTIREGDTLNATVYDMVAQASTREARIWEDPGQPVEGFYSANKSTSESIAESNPTKYLNRHTADHTTAFKNLISEIIANIDTISGATKKEIRLTRLGAFLALTLCQAATKNQNQLGKAFLNHQYKVNLETVAQWPARYPFAPPCRECLQMCECGLIKGLFLTSRLFIILASEFRRANLPDSFNQSTSEFLSASVLTDTALNGLGMIKMVDLVCQYTGMTWEDLKRKTCSTITEHSWERICDFYKAQRAKDNTQYGYHWARIINDGYLRRLSPKESRVLATILTAVLEKYQGDGVWKAAWAKTGAVVMDNAKLFGYNLFEESQRNRKALPNLMKGDEIPESDLKKLEEHFEKALNSVVW